MQSTITLLERALAIHPAPFWTEKLKLSRNALYVARNTGRLSPVIAGSLAIELDEDPAAWMATAVIEGEKESPAKAALARKLAQIRKL